MKSIFKMLGVGIGFYVIHSLYTGEVYAASGMSGRTFYRDQDPVGYWSAIVSYSLLVLGLIFVF